MGKHDKVTFKWEPSKEDYYKERINSLEKQNEDLRAQIKKLQDALGNMELCIEHGENISQGINNELKAEIEELKEQNERLKEALVKSALREV